MRLKLARVAKIDVFLHWTFFLAPAYLIFVSRSQNIDWQIIGILLGLLVAVFTCVLLHEYGHALMARWFGVETKDIIITPIGGLARLQGMPRRPIEEFMITIAGPLVNLVIAIIFALIIFASDGNWIPGVADDPLASVVSSAQNSTVSGYEGLTDFLPLMLWAIKPCVCDSTPPSDFGCRHTGPDFQFCFCRIRFDVRSILACFDRHIYFLRGEI